MFWKACCCLATKTKDYESAQVFKRPNEVAINVFSMPALFISLKNVIPWLEIEMEDIKESLSKGQNTGRFGSLIRSVYFQM